MKPGRMWRDLRGQSRWWLRVMLLSASCTFVSLVMRGPDRPFGGPVLYFAVLTVSGATAVLMVALLLLRRRDRAGGRPGSGSDGGGPGSGPDGSGRTAVRERSDGRREARDESGGWRA